MDDFDIAVPGARDVREALSEDPIYRFIGLGLTSPWILGLILALLVSAMIIFSPSAGSRFIYTDF